MFKFNKKSNPIEETFYNLNRFQKMSIINILQSIAGVDSNIKPDRLKEQEFISVVYKSLNVDSLLAIEYFNQTGIEQMLNDLKSIQNNQKQLLLLYSYQLIQIDGAANEIEFSALSNIFNQLGMSENQILDILKNTNL